MELCRALVLACLILLQLLGCSQAQFDQKPAFACDPAVNATAASLRFCDISVTIGERVTDLLCKLTLEEKIAQLVNSAPAIDHLGIPKYEWWQEALHGVAQSPGVSFGGQVPGATSFPQVILTAASFNETLWHHIAELVSTEARAIHNLARTGLTFWSPNINIFRDPRWGRGQETPGEDPTLTSAYARAFVRGLQGESLEDDAASAPQSLTGPFSLAVWNNVAGPHYLKASACCKHFTAYDLENWNGIDRFHFNAIVSAQDLEDTYQPPFKACIEQGHASSMMCAYNEVNGVPGCANEQFLTTTARNTWGFSGYLVSDCDAVAQIYETFNWTSTPEASVAAALNAGMDLNCGSYVAKYGQAAVSSGLLQESTIDRALGNLYATRMRLGLFDGDPANQAYGNLGASSVCTEGSQKVALEAARQGIVLLKNDNNLLPLSASSVKSLALVGPHADATRVMLGNYEGIPCKYTSPREGFQAYTSVVLQPGCADAACADRSGISAAANAAASNDVTVIVAGLSLEQEAEALDRVDLTLPGFQHQLVMDVAAAAAAACKRVVLVIMSGGPVDITFAKNDERIESILWVGYPGQAGGQAIAEIVFGDVSPSGRLPVTWYPQELVDQVPMTNMAMRADPATNYPGRTYRFYTGRVVYEFGHGLGYNTGTNSRTPALRASFTRAPAFHKLPASASASLARAHGHRHRAVKCGKLRKEDETALSFQVGVKVANSGARDTDYSVLLFARPPRFVEDGPLKQLVGFKRLHVPAGKTITHTFTILPCAHLSHVDGQGARLLYPGLHQFALDGAVRSVLLTL